MSWALIAKFFASKLGQGLLVLGVVALSVALAYNWAYGRGYDAAEAIGAKALTALHAEIDAALIAAERDARGKEAEQRAKNDAVAAKYEEDRNYAQIQFDDDVAALRTGAVRLRTEWAGCETDLLSRTADAAARADDLARLREEGAANLVRLGAECDAQIEGLQGLIR